MNRLLSLALSRRCYRSQLWCIAPGSAGSEPCRIATREWNVGAENCAASSQPSLQVHAYEPKLSSYGKILAPTLNQNFSTCSLGIPKGSSDWTLDAARIRTRCPLAQTVLSFCRGKTVYAFPCSSCTPNKHRDHYACDGIFASFAQMYKVVSPDWRPVRASLDSIIVRRHCPVDLGDPIVDVIPTRDTNRAPSLFTMKEPRSSFQATF